jgi:signal transduction histidine kinase
MTEQNQSQKPIILIVDDVPKNLQVLGTILSNYECELAVAMNGQQALDTIARLKPDLILLDVMMPVMDGHEVCRQLKNSDNTKDIPIIFLTAKVETDDIVKGFELGAVDYVTKPFIGKELLSRVKTHLSLKKAKESLKQEIAAKNKFFSILSHDLRGSFNVILGFLQLMEDYRDDLSVEEINDIIKEAGGTTKATFNLLENLLQWAQSQTNGLNVEPTEFSLNNLVDETKGTLNEIAKQKGILIESAISNNQKAFADINMVATITRNLISNAIKFTPSGGKISISAFKNETHNTIKISDTGVGIEPERLHKLFRIDTKVSTRGTENENGSGLGLMLCKEFVYKNGGEIGIDSQQDKGTTVWFTLPVSE